MSLVKIETNGAVRTVTLNRPEKRNALNLSLLYDIGASLNERRELPVKCAVLTGAGDKAFAAGGDLKELDAIRSEADTRAMSERGHAALDAIRYYPVPEIGRASCRERV